jgi:hypothetical protein
MGSMRNDQDIIDTPCNMWLSVTCINESVVYLCLSGVLWYNVS